MTAAGRAFQPRWDLPASVDATFTCERCSCKGMRASACIHRQRVAAAQRCEAAPDRGQASDYPNCQACPQGLAIREKFDPEHEEFVGVGPGGRRERARSLSGTPPPARRRRRRPAARWARRKSSAPRAAP